MLLMIRLSSEYLGKIPVRWIAIVTTSCQWSVMSTRPITVDINLDHLIKAVYARFLHYKLTVFLFLLYILELSS